MSVFWIMLGMICLVAYPPYSWWGVWLAIGGFLAHVNNMNRRKNLPGKRS